MSTVDCRHRAPVASGAVHMSLGRGIPQHEMSPTMTGKSSYWLYLLAACLVLVVLVIGTEAGRLLTPVRALGAVMGGVLVLTYLVRAPRRYDVVDALVLGALLLFLVTCVTSTSPRFSFEAATTGLAYASAFYVARDATATPKGRRLTILTMALLALILSVLFLLRWGGVWLDWMSIVGPSMPPLDLILPSAPYAGIHAAILIGILAPAPLLLLRRGAAWPMGGLGTAVCLFLVFMSGSRSAWLGMVVALVAAFYLAGGVSRRIRQHPRLLAGAGLATLAAAVVTGPPLLQRLATGSTVELRFAMWGESLERWLTAPLTGVGPGTFPAQLSLTDYNNRFEPWHTHAHNAFIQALMESGLLGAAAVGLVAAALIIGLRRNPALGWAPAAALTFGAAVSLTENPTINPYLVAPLIAWAALGMPRTVRDQVCATAWVRPVNVFGAAVVGAAVAATLVASYSYDRAALSARTGNPQGVVSALRTAVRFDPALAFYHRELGTWLVASGNVRGGRQILRDAIALNPADPAALRALAVVNLIANDRDEALRLARLVADRATQQLENDLTLAYVAQQAGDDDAMQVGLERAVRLAPWLLAAPEWDVLFGDVDKQPLLNAAQASWLREGDPSGRNARARTWLSAMTSEPNATGAVAAEASLLACDREALAQSLGKLTGGEAGDAVLLQARLMYQRAFGVNGVDERELVTLLALHDPGLGRETTEAIMGTPAAGDHNRDVGMYQRIPISPPIGPILPTSASGLSAWLRDPVAAADIGAPASGLAACR